MTGDAEFFGMQLGCSNIVLPTPVFCWRKILWIRGLTWKEVINYPRALQFFFSILLLLSGCITNDISKVETLYVHIHGCSRFNTGTWKLSNTDFFGEKSKFPYNTKFSRKPHLGENIYLVGILAAVQSFSVFLYNTWIKYFLN